MKLPLESIGWVNYEYLSNYGCLNNCLPEYIIHEPADARRWTTQDLQTGITEYHLLDNTGLFEHPEMGWRSQEIRDETYRIDPNDPLSAVCMAVHQALRVYGNKHLEVRTSTELLLQAEEFVMRWELQITENGKRKTNICALG